VLTFTRCITDLKNSYKDWQIDVRTPYPAIWENNPYITPVADDDPKAEKVNVDYVPILNRGPGFSLHFADAFRRELSRLIGAPIQEFGFRPELFFSEAEKRQWPAVRALCGWDGPYWLLDAGHKADFPLKHYPYWQEVVDRLNAWWGGAVKIAQIGHRKDIHPRLRGVLNLVGETDLRATILAARTAHGMLTPLSFPFVLASAVDIPSIRIRAT